MQQLARLAGNVFSGVPLDRVAHRRGDSAWLEARRADAESRYVAVWHQRSVVLNGAEPRAHLHSRESLDGLLDGDAPVALLGVEPGGRALFVVDLSHLPEEALVERSRGGTLLDLRDSVQLLPAGEAATLAYARGLMIWHRRHGYCSQCGHPTEARQAGHQRICTAPGCGAVHFPRTDSAVIVLVHDGEDCLLCRQSRWPKGMHSTLAGFLEPGESLEEAVAREIFEEVGVRVADVRYHSSQPWPFPASIMVGFMARAASREIDMDDDELEHARWYRRDWLKEVEDTDAFRLPGDYSIARRLIGDWLEGRIPD